MVGHFIRAKHRSTRRGSRVLRVTSMISSFTFFSPFLLSSFAQISSPFLSQSSSSSSCSLPLALLVLTLPLLFLLLFLLYFYFSSSFSSSFLFPFLFLFRHFCFAYLYLSLLVSSRSGSLSLPLPFLVLFPFPSSSSPCIPPLLTIRYTLGARIEDFQTPFDSVALLNRSRKVSALADGQNRTADVVSFFSFCPYRYKVSKIQALTEERIR